MRNTPMLTMARCVLVAVFLALIVLAGSGLFLQHVYEFTPERWKARDSALRYQLVESLEKDYVLVGMSESEVEELLGPGTVATGVPDDGHRYEEYRIKDDWIGGWKVLLFEYEDDTVVSVRETWEDW